MAVGEIGVWGLRDPPLFSSYMPPKMFVVVLVVNSPTKDRPTRVPRSTPEKSKAYAELNVVVMVWARKEPLAVALPSVSTIKPAEVEDAVAEVNVMLNVSVPEASCSVSLPRPLERTV